MRLLDTDFKYVPAAQTDVTATWRRFGFRPTTEAERRTRQRGIRGGVRMRRPAVAVLVGRVRKEGDSQAA